MKLLARMLAVVLRYRQCGTQSAGAVGRLLGTIASQLLLAAENPYPTFFFFSASLTLLICS